MISKCELCRRRLELFYETLPATKLFGGVSAKVCTACHSDLDRRIQEHELWPEVVALAARYESLALAAFSGKDTAEEMQANRLRRAELERQFWHIVRGWVPVREPEPAAVAEE